MRSVAQVGRQVNDPLNHTKQRHAFFVEFRVNSWIVYLSSKLGTPPAFRKFLSPRSVSYNQMVFTVVNNCLGAISLLIAGSIVGDVREHSV